jgi:hypothetical protein
MPIQVFEDKVAYDNVVVVLKATPAHLHPGRRAR